jgi:serine/threonine-protein kinase
MTYEERATPVLGIDYGRYNVLRVLGIGSFATVYEAVQKPLGRHIALKVMHPHLAPRADLAARFEQEARVAAAVRHPNVVEVLDYGERARVPYVAMELLEGETLLDSLVRERTLPVPVLVDIVMPVLAALAVMHPRGVVHCDLKPANVFLTVNQGGRLVPKVLDFGVSSFRAAGSAEAPGGAIGTPDYMSPEQVRGDVAPDARADLWALAATLYEGVVGRVPFLGANVEEVFAAVLAGTLEAPRAVRPEVPERFESLLLRALSRDPAERFSRAVDLARALVPFAGDEGRRVWIEDFGQALPATTSSPPVVISTPPAAASSPPATRGSPSLTPSRRPFTPRIAADPRVYLRSVEALARLAPDDADALLSCVRWRAFAPGDVLFREGAPGVTLAFVVEGTLTVCSDAGGVRREFTRVGVGHFVGEMACLDPAPRSATVVAATPAVVGEISREGLRTLQMVAPRASSVIVGAIIREVTQRLREVEGRIDAALASTRLAPNQEPDEPVDEPGGVRRLIDWLRGAR